MLDNARSLAEILAVLFAVVATPIGLWVLREFRVQNKRIDKREHEHDEHIREGVHVHRSLERLETQGTARDRELKTLRRAVERIEEETRRHNENGGRHAK